MEIIPKNKKRDMLQCGKLMYNYPKWSFLILTPLKTGRPRTQELIFVLIGMTVKVKRPLTATFWMALGAELLSSISSVLLFSFFRNVARGSYLTWLSSHFLLGISKISNNICPFTKFFQYHLNSVKHSEVSSPAAVMFRFHRFSHLVYEG